MVPSLRAAQGGLEGEHGLHGLSLRPAAVRSPSTWPDTATRGGEGPESPSLSLRTGLDFHLLLHVLYFWVRVTLKKKGGVVAEKV